MIKTLLLTTLLLSGVCMPEVPDNDAARRMMELGVGWNLGNSLDALPDGFSDSDDEYGWPDETCWGNRKATQQTFDTIKSYGFTFVRIPVTWARFIGPAPDYTLDAGRLERVAEVIGYAHNAGLRVVMDTHHDECWYLDWLEDLDERIRKGRIDADKRDYYIKRFKEVYWLNIADAVNDEALNAQIKAKIKAVWTQLALRFRDCGDWLMFDAKAQRIPYVDYHSVLKNENNGMPENYAADGVHPNLDCYKIMEEIVLRYL